MSFWTYILRCSNGIYYTGHTDDIDRRIAEHQSGAIKGYTYDKRPVERFWRDLRVHSILEGTNQIMRVIVARDILRQ